MPAKSMTQIHIYPSLNRKDLQSHIGTAECPCNPQSVIVKGKRFVFHHDPNNGSHPPEYDPESYEHLPSSYKYIVESHIEKLRKKPPAQRSEPQKAESTAWEKPKSMRGISRIDSSHTHGWFVRVYKDGVTHSKMFSDKKLGGKERALELAKEHRDRLRAELGVPDRDRKANPRERVAKKLREQFARRRRPGRFSVQRIMRQYTRSKTGIVGVYRAKDTAWGNEYYTVSYYGKPNERRSKCFSISKYGEEKAFELACEMREEYLRTKVYKDQANP